MDEEKEYAYGSSYKTIRYIETDHRHAKLILKLRHDGFKQNEFFKQIVTSYLEDDKLFMDYIESVRKLSLQRLKKSNKLKKEGQELCQNLGLTENEKDDIFDIIAQESPELFKIENS